MWPRKNVDLYVHIEFELPDRFYCPLTMGPYQCLNRSTPIPELTEYIGGLSTFPNIVARIQMDGGTSWLVFLFKDFEQLDDFCRQIDV